MAESLDANREEKLGESAALQDALLTRSAKHTISVFSPKWRKPVENEVLSAAAYFYRKFFCVHSLISYDQVSILLSALALACKTEESHNITLKDLCGSDIISAEEAAEYELALLAALDFKIEVSQPWPVILLFASRLAERGKPDMAQKLFDVSCELVGSWQWTDAVVVFPLPLLAIGAAYQASDTIGVGESFAEIAISEFGADKLPLFASLPEKIRDVINRHPRPSPEAMDAMAERFGEAIRLENPSKRRRKPDSSQPS
jgi:hypothetical protein